MFRRLNLARTKSWSLFKTFCRGNSSVCEQLESGHCSGTMADVIEKISKQIGLEPGYHTIPKSRENLLAFQPKHEELPTRSMQDSYTTALIPLGDDELARERYVNHLGRLRFGRLLEELDMFAVWICHRHLKIPTLPEEVPLPYTFVTLLVDTIEFMNHDHIRADIDIQLSGHVSWTGRSSLDIPIYVRQKDVFGVERTITRAIFMMVARNATNTGSAPVNPLKPANELEQECWKEAVERQKQRRTKHAKSVFLVEPTKNEEQLMYDLFKRTNHDDILEFGKRTLPAKCRWMDDSYQTTIIHPFPENRNAQNTIFGGFIMRNAVENSFITASIYVRGRPILEYISDISFMAPVKVNSFLRMTAYVVYTAENYVQLMTVAHIIDGATFVETATNAFYLTYSSDTKVEEVLPRSYQETLWYIHGRRKLLAVKNVDGYGKEPPQVDPKADKAKVKAKAEPKQQKQ
ncbi:acyl-coenzyme A thioesterase 9, mitochondrial-like [Scaptodrosophila lebanonensis]|uniref:Acyl-coenzyme A thioesterase 9, mitochondrial-like n=1 Tax=Drosophila lebanonensis TaxID=7225 RepID=A0A6J2TRT5_DROLE|nr:acyl-coenzyme A thioesterase 9, mitochondrial-like [Scaptodrosophila lebanonensis]